ncbi:nitrile hydratase subunit beta [Natronorubrum sp. JWXQ-INN-674]|uniref:nitrile hydratase n=1 Tax=Natronorubrum halalkaliphilum TaxID=2691917 RepID=A0A6B0VQH8_9EURY|nr:nitrile hydratase subunit beta [Natronorubrum halalkaliphilum]MXV63433.1 nitrile hydratase subunit beta [Natronorubrum halalkaliphilum]
MNGIHDMGGMHGFGTVPVDDDAQFHADWERVVYALVRAIRPQEIYNIDESRYGIERMAPADYLAATYFERWLASLERNLVETGQLTADEIEDAHRRARDLENPAEFVTERRDPDLADRVRDVFEQPASFDRPDDDPQFAEGDAVCVRNDHPEGHTRCPRYVRRTTGEIRDVHGNYVFPDASARGEERDEPLYTVAFDAEEVWGADAEHPDDTIHVDLWEPYLRPAEETDD